MRSSVIISAILASIVGFGGSVAIIIAAGDALGATEEQMASWVAVLCIAMMGTTAVLSIRHRMPIVTAWSTPGAALIAATTGVTMDHAVGAFFFAAALILLTAVFRPLATLIEKIPTSVASAMLAGVLFSFVVSIFEHVQLDPILVLPLIAAFLVLRLYSPAWSVLVVLVFGIALSIGLDRTGPVGELQFSNFVWITPVFDFNTILGIGLPLYLVTMAAQNLPGFAVLRAAGYQPPARSILTVTGLASFLSAGFGAHTSNLAAITASICTNEDAHPDPEKRWLCGPFYAGCYAIFAIFGASLVTLFSSFPDALIFVVAGIALTGPFMSSLAASFSDKEQIFTAAVTFAVTASGISAMGLGSAFWGLVAGLLVVGLEKFRFSQKKKTA